MADSPVFKLVFDWRDREGNRARTTMYAPFSSGAEEAAAMASAAYGHLTTLSNATIVRQSISHTQTDLADPSSAGDALVSSKLLLFYRNGDIYEWIMIPAPKAELFETEGPYSGIRVDYANPAVIALIDALTGGLGDVKTVEGDEFPSFYLVGGQFI